MELCMIERQNEKIPGPNPNNLRSVPNRGSEGCPNEVLHLSMEKEILLRNMKTVFDVGTQMIRDLDVEIDELRMKLRNL